ncbi:MAG TPA: sigma-54 dependent transcriptional regulator [Candidatus Polarisedimenticolaceae bacterium]|nr:sigma-54 dependent transcriptional regulator [Candidatus Polarisedimenticolaceae bacterium]
MMAHENILIVEDEKLIRWSIKSRLEDEGYTVAEVDTGKKAFDLWDQGDFDLMLLDFRLPDTTGVEILRRVKQQSPETSVVMMTAYGTVESAVEAMKLGAFDYLTKPVNLEELVVIVEKALETTSLRREVRRLRNEHREIHGNVQLIGRSRAMLEIIELVEKVCASQATTVLLEGDSGTGKNVVAKAIHYGSPRVDKPFVTITCSALTETLLESELFGHERGAFTDAKTQKKGLLEVADGGTAFLDEIGEMGMAMQAKLLRFLEEKTFKRVGGTRDIEVEVRIIAATNRDLHEAVREGRFREDLYYRLKVIPIRLPSLRERRDDIPLLVQHFLDHFNQEFRKNTTRVEPAAMERLKAYDWPGNIRELRNFIERVMILESKECIELADLPRAMRDGLSAVEPTPAADSDPSPISLGAMTLEEMERAAIVQALEQVSQNQVRAAKLLGITRDTLRYRMKKFGLLDGLRE